MTKELTNVLTEAVTTKNIEAFRNEWYQFYKSISKANTPKYDGNGLELIRKRPDGLDYIIEAFMKDRLNFYFPGWSWRRTSPPQLLGAEWVITDGELTVIDKWLMTFNINPPYRYFAATGAARIQFKRNMPHTPDNLVDLDKQVKAANTNAFKKAINQLLGIGDDIYGKRIEEEGAGSLEEILEDDIVTTSTSGQEKAFVAFVEQKRLRWSVVFKMLSINSIDEITDYKVAFENLKEKLNKGGDAQP